MKKIVIIGSPGAGKSTLAQKLSGILGIDVFHLDRYFWQPGWKEYSRQVRIGIEQHYILTQEQWIIEGSYLSSSDNRLRAADTIIFLDTPYFLCLWRVLKRHLMFRGLTRPDLPSGCTDRIDVLRIVKIVAFPHRERKLLLAKVDEACQPTNTTASKKTFIRLTSNKQVEEFLLQQAAISSEAKHLPQSA